MTKRTREETAELIERNQEAYVEGWLQPDQFAHNMAALSAEMDAHDELQQAKTDLAFALAQGDGYAEDEAAERIERLEREIAKRG